MSASTPQVTVHVNIDLPAQTLETVVANAKKKAAADAGGRARVDPAGTLSALITRFLQDREFGDYVGDIDNY